MAWQSYLPFGYGGVYDAQQEKKERQGILDEVVGDMPGEKSSLLGPNVGATGAGAYQGAGLLGNQITPMQAGAMLLKAPGMRKIGGALLQQQMVNDARMQEHMTMSPYQQGQLDLAQQQNLINNFRQQNNDWLAQANKQFGQYMPLMSQKRNTVEMVSKANDALPTFSNGAVNWDAASKDGTIAHQAVVTLAKSILPTEAVMTDDQGNIRLAGGAPGWLASMVAMVNGGTMGSTQLEAIYKRMNANAQADMATLTRLRADAERLPGGGAMLPSPVDYRDYRRPASQFAPPGPAGGTTNMQTPKPVTTRPGG